MVCWRCGNWSAISNGIDLQFPITVGWEILALTRECAPDQDGTFEISAFKSFKGKYLAVSQIMFLDFA